MMDGDVARLEARVEHAPRMDDHDGALLAETVTAGLDDCYLVAQAAPGEFLVDGGAQGGAT